MSIKRLVVTLLASYCTLVGADDTELFVSDVVDSKPQVLIIFDNSGSMTTQEEVAQTPYDSDDYDAPTESTKIYWSSNANIPSPTSNQFFYVKENNCNASLASLANTGFYTGNVRRWDYNSKKSSKSSWKTLKKNSGDTYDCKDDYLNADTANPGTGESGYPTAGSNGPYSTTASNVFSGNDSVTLYAASYIDWNENSNSTTMSRIEIAKAAITSLIGSTPSVDFGLEVFNKNNSNNDRSGGRIVDKVQSRDEDEIAELISTINSLEAKTNTPLCESLYEAYRYYAGKSLYFGDDDTGSEPPRDKTAESNGVYISPIQACQEEAYIILMTDGQPYNDEDANTVVKNLTGGSKIESSFMPTLSGWMYTNDIDGDADNGIQHIKTYTIGFGKSAVDSAGLLLTATAEKGGGEYYPAEDSAALQNAFQETILDILNDTSSLSSPAISSNSFDRTRSLDSVYYAMFLPSTTSVWRGNIKKLSLNSAGVIVDRLGDPAIDEDGNIMETASTYWGGDEDGNTVTEGGVSALYESIDSRTILSNIDATDSTVLKAPNINNLKTFYGFTNNTDLADELNVDDDQLSASLSWLTGVDVDDQDEDNDSTDYREDIFADPLHSQPLGVTYTENNDNVVRLLVGTNAGFLHMFTDNGDTVSENWAFIPEELLNTGLATRYSVTTSEHQYGMDLSPIAIKTVDSDGDISQIIAIVGMRRGGSGYYALDITSPNAPTLLWKIDASSDGFEELGQTWSIPSSGTFSYKRNGSIVSVPGIVFGAGYDTNKDDCSASSSQPCDDSIGRGVFVVNAITGEKIWSTDGTSCETDDVHCMRDSIPSQVELLDSDGDGYTDRIYTGDTGGNLWRMDLVGTDTDKWSTIKLAALGGDSASQDRRFFSPPVIVRTYKSSITKIDDDNFSYATIPYDGLLIGSGDRANPISSTDVDDIYFALQDYVISGTLFGENGYLAKPTPSTTASFYSITADPVGNASDSQLLDVYAELSGYAGWKYELTALGEKSLGQGAVLDGVSYFTSFEPNSAINVECGVGDFGVGWLYAVDLHSGERVFSNSNGDAIDKIDIGSRVPASLVTHSGVDDQDQSVLRLLGVGQGDEQTVYNEETGEEETIYTGSVETDTDMMPRRIYSYFKEN